MIRNVLFLSPESPYPLHGGGQYRTASLIHYFAEFASVDVILFSENGKPALLPPGLVRSQTTIPLPVHGKTTWERYRRNARRAVLGVPPLIDRLSGLNAQIREAIGDRRYDIGVIEHFWLAPYLPDVAGACDRTLLDLHNVESVLHARCAQAESGLVAAGHRRFARASRKLEKELLPKFSGILATSESDQETAREIAAGAHFAVYPNAIPDIPRPGSATENVIVFSGNFEYHPNIDAVRYFAGEIWPGVRAVHPELRLRLVGRGDECIRRFLPQGAEMDRAGIEITGPVAEAMPHIAAAKLVIAPLRAGSGTRIKILEAWAAARAVVATPLAAEGLEIRDGENIAIAATPREFVETILRLLASGDERERLANSGRATFEERYTWPVAWRTLDEYLQVTRDSESCRYTK